MPSFTVLKGAPEPAQRSWIAGTLEHLEPALWKAFPASEGHTVARLGSIPAVLIASTGRWQGVGLRFQAGPRGVLVEVGPVSTGIARLRIAVLVGGFALGFAVGLALGLFMGSMGSTAKESKAGFVAGLLTGLFLGVATGFVLALLLVPFQLVLGLRSSGHVAKAVRLLEAAALEAAALAPDRGATPDGRLRRTLPAWAPFLLGALAGGAPLVWFAVRFAQDTDDVGPLGPIVLLAAFTLPMLAQTLSRLYPDQLPDA